MKSILLIFIVFNFFSCTVNNFSSPLQPAINQQKIFWAELNKLCGQAFEGSVAEAPTNDTAFRNKKLIMHVRSCSENAIRIPFFVGSDRSRTWVLTNNNNAIGLKHDHRHQDGTEDSITQYGGFTPNSGSATVQMFPADQQTVNILPAAATNVWWVELIPGKSFTYNLRRMGTDRLFSIRFDLTKPVDAPEAPWGWKD